MERIELRLSLSYGWTNLLNPNPTDKRKRFIIYNSLKLNVSELTKLNYKIII